MEVLQEPTQDEQVDNAQVPPSMFFWNSQDACNLFGVTLERPEDDVRDALTLQIKVLQSVSNDHNGWRNVIDGRDPENICSSFDNAQVPPSMFFWNSQDACNLFGVTLERPEDDVRDALTLQIKVL